VTGSSRVPAELKIGKSVEESEANGAHNEAATGFLEIFMQELQWSGCGGKNEPCLRRNGTRTICLAAFFKDRWPQPFNLKCSSFSSCEHLFIHLLYF
jgi:hypothetical protein